MIEFVFGFGLFLILLSVLAAAADAMDAAADDRRDSLRRNRP